MTIHEPRIARDCCRIMREHGFVPKTLINIGVGRCPEYEVWKEQLPTTRLIGIDARARAPFWGGEYIHAALSDGQHEIAYCGICRHVRCNDQKHARKHHKMEANTLDALLLSRREPVANPLFIWMDLDGSEIDTMRGGKLAFAFATFVNCEVRDFSFAPNNAKAVQRYLWRLGFDVCHVHERTNDVLFVRKQ